MALTFGDPIAVDFLSQGWIDQNRLWKTRPADKTIDHEGHEVARRKKQTKRNLREPEPALSEVEGCPLWLMPFSFSSSAFTL
jgi:hypothetical protein